MRLVKYKSTLSINFNIFDVTIDYLS
uniref:Uncharacterized protein n=1 Tax=Anguilla anguilla TaxID=7936 RepID=A0A0E9UR74_ANGAN